MASNFDQSLQESLASDLPGGGPLLDSCEDALLSRSLFDVYANAPGDVYASDVYSSDVYASGVHANDVYANDVYASDVYASNVYADAPGDECLECPERVLAARM
jgi:hypothetical protein